MRSDSGETAATVGDSGGIRLEDKEALTVIVVGARNLAARDKDGLADPYCVVTVGDEQVETHAVPRNRSPRWACEFTLPVSGGGAGQELVVRVLDRATSSFMGECRLSLDGFLDTPLRYATEHSYPLSRELGTARKQALTSKEAKKQRKQRKKQGKKYDLISGEIILKMGYRPSKSDSRARDAAISSKPLRFQDYDDVDIEDINDEARYLATQSNLAAKRALRVTEATKKLASDTAIKLHEQGDQIRNAQGSVSQIHLDLKESNRELRSISSVFGQIANAATSGNHKYKHIDRKRMKEEELAREKAERDRLEGRTDTDQKRKEFERKQQKRAERDRMRRLLADGKFDHLGQDTVCEMEETEQVLDSIGDGLDYLKGIATEMRAEVKKHNEMLEVLADGTDVANEGIQRTTRRVQRQ